MHRAQLLAVLRNKNGDEGFSLIELAVVVVIIGILAALAAPSYLNAQNRARQSEGVLNVGNMNKAQQNYYLENNIFAPDLATLAAGIPTSTNNYEFSTTTAGSGVSASSISQATLLPGSSLAGFVGVNQLSINAAGAVNNLSIICRSLPGVEAIAPASGTDLNSPTACGANQIRQ